MESSALYIAAPIAGWLAAQALKYLIAYRSRKLEMSDLFTSGGMPSSHSATTTALVVALGSRLGITHPVTAVAALLAAIVIYDATGVRRAVGEQRKAIEALQKLEKAVTKPHLYRSEGHTPMQAFAGVLTGAACALILTRLIA